MPLYESIRPLLFRLDPERAHRLTLRLLEWSGRFGGLGAVAGRAWGTPPVTEPVEAFGLRFANPVGLAAGYDKDGRGMHGLARLGFGHLELGTVTPQAQSGNPRPRIFRLPEDRALINRMGFPNQGVAALVRRLRQRPSGVVIGVNIGKGVATPMEGAARDYLGLLRTLHPHADYLAVNVSSPNTPGLRELQGRAQLVRLLASLSAARGELGEPPKPLLVKLAPDLSESQLAEAVQAIGECGMDGVIACNTTTARPVLFSARRQEPGGLSGAPLRERSLQMIRRIRELSAGRLPVVANGGILSGSDAREALQAGACLIQLYTGLVYRGPGLVREILEALAPRQERVAPPVPAA